MPIEIKELHIRVTVNPPVPTGTAPAAQTSAKPAAVIDDRLIAECAEHVMQIMKTKHDR
jgi:hypothetical protein